MANIRSTFGGAHGEGRAHGPVLKHKLITVYSGDRDTVAYPETNSYEIDVPVVPNSAGIKLASFEMQSTPQYTFRDGVNNEIHFSQGLILGGQLDATLTDGSHVYENEIRVEMTDISANVSYLQMYFPPHDLQSTLVHDSTSGGIHVYCDGAHGLYSANNANAYTGPDVWLLASNQGNVLLADNSGVKSSVLVLNETELYIPPASVVSDAPDGDTEGGLIHARPYSADELVSMINAKGTDYANSAIRLSSALKDGKVTLTLRHPTPLTRAKLQYSDNSVYRGMGHVFGQPPKLMQRTSQRSTQLWETTSRVQPNHFVMRLADGIYDIGDLGTNIFERSNNLNLASNRAYDQNGLQLGVTTHIGQTFAIRIPVGKYNVDSLGTTLVYQLQTVATPTMTWSYTYDRTDRLWTICNSSGHPFTFHFSYTAEPGTSWATSAGVPSTGAASVTHFARLLGFVPNSAVHSDASGCIRSVVASSMLDEIAYPRFDNAQDNVITQSAPSNYRHPHFTTVISTREPSTRKIGFGTRNPHVVNVSVDDASSHTVSGVGGASGETVGVTALGITPTGYTIDPTLPIQVGQIVRLGNTSTNTMLAAQVTEMDGSAVSATLRVDSSAWSTSLNGSGVPIDTMTLAPYDSPVLDIYKTSTAATRLGLTSDLVHVEDFKEMPAMWNVEHDAAILLQIEPVGANRRQAESFTAQSSGIATSALARIPVRTNGITHINSLGAQELIYDAPHTLSRVKVEMRNADGTIYQSNKVDHTFGINVAYY